MDRMTEDKVKACLPCQIVTPIYTREPLQMFVLPDNPFDEVSVDFASVNGETLLLLVDDYSSLKPENENEQSPPLRRSTRKRIPRKILDL
jgi:hypothetical protein